MKTEVEFNNSGYLLCSVYTLSLCIIIFLQTICNSWAPELESDMIAARTNSW